MLSYALHLSFTIHQIPECLLTSSQRLTAIKILHVLSVEGVQATELSTSPTIFMISSKNSLDCFLVRSLKPSIFRWYFDCRIGWKPLF